MGEGRKRNGAHERERQRGAGPNEEPAMTMQQWMQQRGYCGTCRTYHEGTCDESPSRTVV